MYTSKMLYILKYVSRKQRKNRRRKCVMRVYNRIHNYYIIKKNNNYLAYITQNIYYIKIFNRYPVLQRQP